MHCQGKNRSTFIKDKLEIYPDKSDESDGSDNVDGASKYAFTLLDF